MLRPPGHSMISWWLKTKKDGLSAQWNVERWHFQSSPSHEETDTRLETGKVGCICLQPQLYMASSLPVPWLVSNSWFLGCLVQVTVAATSHGKVQLVADTKRPSRSMAAFRWVWCSTSKSCEETTQHWHFYVSVKACSKIFARSKKHHYIHKLKKRTHFHRRTFLVLDVFSKRGHPQLRVTPRTTNRVVTSPRNLVETPAEQQGYPMEVCWAWIGTGYPRDVYAIGRVSMGVNFHIFTNFPCRLMTCWV